MYPILSDSLTVLFVLSQSDKDFHFNNLYFNRKQILPHDVNINILLIDYLY